MQKRVQAYNVVLRNESLGFRQKGTLEATIVRALQMTSPPARSRGLSALSAKNPTGTKANAYSTCIASDDQEWVPGHKLYLRKVCFFSTEFKTHCHTQTLALESSVQKRLSQIEYSQHDCCKWSESHNYCNVYRVSRSQHGSLSVCELQIWGDEGKQRRKCKTATGRKLQL